MGDAPTWADFVLAFDLFRDAILCGAAAGAALGYLGVFIVLRRMVFTAAVLSQAAGLGVALGFFAEIYLHAHLPPTAWALTAALAAAGLMSLPAERLRISREAVLALIWIASGAGAVLIGDKISQEAHDIAAILFGTAVLVRPVDLYLVLGVGGASLGFGVASRRGLIFAGFDPTGARVQGLPVRALELGFLASVTALVAVSTRALGALPVFALSVLPGIAALLAAPRLSAALPLALLGGALSGAVGYLAAFFFSLPVGAAQSAVAAALILIALPIRLLRGG